MKTGNKISLILAAAFFIFFCVTLIIKQEASWGLTAMYEFTIFIFNLKDGLEHE